MLKRLMRRLSIVWLITVLVLTTACARKPPSEAERDRQFQQQMSGVTLVGYSTSLRRSGLSQEERYSIDGISKVGGETWLFRTRLKYGEKEIPVPIPVTVKWAGDTPVITLTDLAIPGVGTFTARVLLYRDQYAGTWSGGKAGGQLFGKIVRSGASGQGQ
jgi:hypothetical protein